jgi:hypothetical protein
LGYELFLNYFSLTDFHLPRVFRMNGIRRAQVFPIDRDMLDHRDQTKSCTRSNELAIVESPAQATTPISKRHIGEPKQEANRLQQDQSFRDTVRVLKMTRFMVGWEATGCAMGAYENALKYCQERLQFGKPIASFQLVQDLLAKMLANITASQCLLVRMAQLQAEHKLTDAHASLAKAFTTAKCRETVAWARELLGGNGIAADYNVARFFTDAEALYSYEGTYQMQNLILGKTITGFSAFI